MLINVHDAKTRLSQLIAAAEAGEEVVIARRGRPAVRLVPVEAAPFRLGALAHLTAATPDFDDPVPPDELDAWEGA